MNPEPPNVAPSRLNSSWHHVGKFAMFCLQPNKKLMRKIPSGAEGASIMIGQVDFLEELVLAFYRFRPSQVIEELTEVAIPTRFIIVVLGPQKNSSISEYFEIGRAFAALLNDKVSLQLLLFTMMPFMDGWKD